MTPPPDGDHEDCIELIVAQVYERSRTRMQLSGNKALELHSGGGCPKDRVIPDGTSAPGETRLHRGRTRGCPAKASPWSLR